MISTQVAAIVTASDTHSAIDAVWRIESAKIIAGLARLLRDVGLAEELAQDALVVALEKWPASGIPDNPGAWLMAVAKRRALDELRRRKLLERKHEQLGYELELEQQMADADSDRAAEGEVGDDLLRLMFIACHPVLSTEARAALTLRLLGGLTTDEIARAFLVPEPTIAQRIVRAKRTLSNSGLAYETPSGEALSERLASVLEVVYLIFNEGYAASRGDDWMRPQLCQEALRLGRVLVSIAPTEPEAYGLLALMELNASRAAARVDAGGEPILLLEQDRRRWDFLQIRRGLQALGRAQTLGGQAGFYVLQAEIVACHARAEKAEVTDWRHIAALYAQLSARQRSPVIELNRAVAVGMAEGPLAGLAIVDSIAHEPALQNYHLLPGVRGDFLQKLGRLDEARAAFETAAELAGNGRDRSLMQRRAREVP